MPKKCPHCGLLNPPSAMRCDCGYVFSQSSYEREKEPPKQNEGKDYHRDGPVHTHYYNLKVARSAPPEVICAAYKSLSQKYHPDKNPGNAEAVRIMAILNASYEVLSNSDKRKEHDVWIAKQEKEGLAAEKSQRTLHRSDHPATASSQEGQSTTSGISLGGVAAHASRVLDLVRHSRVLFVDRIDQ